MSKIYDDGTFKRYKTTAPTKPIVEMSREEENCFSQQNQLRWRYQNGHQRIPEKLKELRHKFSKAVIAGSGSEKFIYEFYDDMISI